MAAVENQVIALTGAGSGIGRALALQLAQKGAKLALSDRDIASLDETKDMLGNAHVITMAVDVAEKEQLEAFAAKTQADFGAVNGIINNAGVALMSNTATTSLEDFHWVMDINFWGVVYGTQAFLPHIQAQGSGFVANLSSIFGLIAFPENGAYNASKFAVRGYTEALRIDLAKAHPGIHIASVHPGGISTNIFDAARFTGKSDEKIEKSRRSFKRASKTTPEQAAETIIIGLERGKHRILIGKDARMIDKVQRLFPERYSAVLKKLGG